MADTNNSPDSQYDSQEDAEDMHLVYYTSEAGRLIVNPPLRLLPLLILH